MKNLSMRYFDSIIKIRVKGKNIDNYIKKIIKQKINVIKLTIISHKEVELLLEYQEYLKLKKYKSIYEIEIISKHGRLKLKEILKKNIILFICLAIAIIVILGLSKVIFNIEIIHSDHDIVNLLTKELKDYDIKKFRLKKSYEELEKIEDEILEKNKDKLEWIEIEEVGTKYIVRVEERILNEENEGYLYQDIIATKSGIITQINATSGEKVKSIGSYIKNGDVVISGNITLPDGSSVLTKAMGSIYAEVWYTIDIEYPYIYREEILTGKKKEVYIVNFLGKRISLFDFKKFNSFQSTPKIIFYNSLIPISFVKEKQYEVNVIDEVYTEDEVVQKAMDYAKDKLLKQNKKIESVKKINVIDKKEDASKVSLKLFISVIEEISATREIKEEILEQEQPN